MHLDKNTVTKVIRFLSKEYRESKEKPPNLIERETFVQMEQYSFFLPFHHKFVPAAALKQGEGGKEMVT